MKPPCAISDLREAPQLAATVADRVWRAWWEPNGVPLSALRARLDESFGPALARVPSSFVAHRHGVFLGTVALIARDMEERPQLRPWVAALWVEPEMRRQGIGATLVAQAAQAAFAAGHERVYLCATAPNAPYYLGIGWTRIEVDVAGVDIFVLEAGR